MSTQPKIRFSCPKCNQKISTPAELGGKKGKCPACGHTVLIPAAPEAVTDEDYCRAFVQTVTQTAGMEREPAEKRWHEFGGKFAGNCRVVGAKIPRQKVQEMQLQRVTFEECDFTKTEVTAGTALKKCVFSSCIFAESIFKTSFFIGSHFQNCSFQRARIDYSPRDGVDFSSCDFRNATIQTSHSLIKKLPSEIKSQFSHANMKGSSFVVDTEPSTADRVTVEYARGIVSQLFTPEQRSQMNIHLQVGDPLGKAGYSNSAWFEPAVDGEDEFTTNLDTKVGDSTIIHPLKATVADRPSNLRVQRLTFAPGMPVAKVDVVIGDSVYVLEFEKAQLPHDDELVMRVDYLLSTKYKVTLAGPELVKVAAFISEMRKTPAVEITGKELTREY